MDGLTRGALRNDGHPGAPGDQEVYAVSEQTWHRGRAQAERLRGGEDIRAGRKYTLKPPPHPASRSLWVLIFGTALLLRTAF